MNKIFRQTLLTASALAITVSMAAGAADLPDFVELAQSAGPAVVNISTEREVSGRMGRMMPNMPPGMERFFEQFGPFMQDQVPRKQSSLGSGFIISHDGYIVTNNHVVEGANKVFVTLEGQGPKVDPLEAKVIGTDAETDLALLKVESDKPLPTLTFGDSDSLEVGEWVVAIGNPFGLSNTVTAGILSAKGRDIHSGPFDNFLQTDASINPGNSGGPLINMKGEVVGINTAIVASGQGIGFAIPSRMAQSVVAELQGDNNRVSRGWLGVTIQDVDQNMAKALGLKSPRGALIGAAMPNEPADKAGLKAGDIIVRIGKEDIVDSSDLLRKVADLKPGIEVKVVVIRNGKEFSTNVVLGERANRDAAGRTVLQEEESEGISLGISIRPLTREDIRNLQLAPGTKGLLIVNVQPGGPADQSGLAGGDVITSANLTPMDKVEDLSRIVKKEGKERGAIMLQVNRRGESFFVTLELNAK